MRTILAQLQKYLVFFVPFLFVVHLMDAAWTRAVLAGGAPRWQSRTLFPLGRRSRCFPIRTHVADEGQRDPSELGGRRHYGWGPPELEWQVETRMGGRRSSSGSYRPWSLSNRLVEP